MSEEIVKVCKKHGALTLKQTYPRKGVKWIFCRACRSERVKSRLLKNPESLAKYRENARKWKAKNIEKVRDYASDYYKKNKDKYLLICKNYNRNSRKELKDKYIKKLICARSSLRHRDIPVEYVDFYRETLLLKREIKNVNKESSRTKGIYGAGADKTTQ